MSANSTHEDFFFLNFIVFSSSPLLCFAEYQSELRSVCVAASSTAVSQLWACTAYSALSTPTLHFPKTTHWDTHTLGHIHTHTHSILSLFTTLYVIITTYYIITCSMNAHTVLTHALDIIITYCMKACLHTQTLQRSHTHTNTNADKH